MNPGNINYKYILKSVLALFLQMVVLLIGIGTLVLMLWEPHVEGRNAHATLGEIYFHDPFLAYVYISSLPFFVILYQMFKLLRLAGKNTKISEVIAKKLRTIKYCAIAIVGLVMVGEIFIILSESNDRSGGFFIGAVIIFCAIVMATVSAKLERKMIGYQKLAN